jgi:hypothetical protein
MEINEFLRSPAVPPGEIDAQHVKTIIRDKFAAAIAVENRPGNPYEGESVPFYRLQKWITDKGKAGTDEINSILSDR